MVAQAGGCTSEVPHRWTTAEICGWNTTVRRKIWPKLHYPLAWSHPGINNYDGTVGAARVCGVLCASRRVRVCDVVLCEVLPGSGRRMRAAGQIGEFAGDRSPPPQFGAALAETGGKSEGGTLRSNEQAAIRRRRDPLLTDDFLHSAFLTVTRVRKGMRRRLLETAARVAPARSQDAGGGERRPRFNAPRR